MKIHIPHNAVVALNLNRCPEPKKATALMGRHLIEGGMVFSRPMNYDEALDCRERWGWALGIRDLFTVLPLSITVDTESKPVDWGTDANGSPTE